jgi:hypothetical protein
MTSSIASLKGEGVCPCLSGAGDGGIGECARVGGCVYATLWGGGGGGGGESSSTAGAGDGPLDKCWCTGGAGEAALETYP